MVQKHRDIESQALKVGDYVRLGESEKRSWQAHPFRKNNFQIESEAQLEQIKALFSRVVVSHASPDKVPVSANSPLNDQSSQHMADSSAQDWAEINSPTEKISRVFNSELTNHEKSAVIIEQSAAIIENLFSQTVTKASVQQAAGAIEGMVGNLIADPDLSDELLRITAHDYYTYTHSVSVGLKSLLFAKYYLGTADERLLQTLGSGFFLHDIGKAGVDPAILNKPGKLDQGEWQIMRKHPEQGIELLRQADSLNDETAIVVVQHHEKLDGTGYPYGLKGREFHEFGQICALADIFDALTAKRSYKEGMSSFDALMLIKHKMSHHFDSKILTSFIKMFCDA